MKIVIKEKQCPGCQKRRLLNEFCKNKIGKTGRKAVCRICRKEYQQCYAKNNLIKIKLRQKIYYKKHRKELLEWASEWQKNNPEKRRAMWKKTDIRRGNELKELSDVAIIRCLCYRPNVNVIYLKRSDVTQDLIKAKRAHLQAFRLLQLVKKGVAI